MFIFSKNTVEHSGFTDSKTLKESKREELFECMKADTSMGWAVDVIDPRRLSSLMLAKFEPFLMKSSRTKLGSPF